ncbi:MAG: glycosyltransferase [Planctomycetes bacterium]|nr:glycosyltransferase [Planctomycetota bacterium]
MTERLRLVVVGNRGGTNVGESFERAARALGHEVLLVDARRAMEAPRLVRRVSWWLRGRTPPRLVRFEEEVLTLSRAAAPDVVLTTGTAPLRAGAVDTLRARGAVVVNYSTDDPWNPAHRAAWFLEALPRYDLVCSTRRANAPDLAALGCRRVAHVPFGYDPALCFPEPAAAPASDVLYVGGGEGDRVPYLHALATAGLHVALHGTYWDRYPETRRLTRGQAGPELVRRVTAATRIALCLVRRANRDGSCMRTFEIPAVGACALVEDTVEHRDLFGVDGEAALYFDSPAMLVDRARWLLARDDERRRLAARAHALITTGGHTYADRLREVLRLATGARA